MFSFIPVPTDKIPEVCLVQNLGKQNLKQEDAFGTWTSTEAVKMTSCNGICQSSFTMGTEAGKTGASCKCCQPASVKKVNVEMSNSTATKIITHYEITSCTCQKTTCQSAFNMASVAVEGTKVRRSLFDSLDTGSLEHMDDDTYNRHRKSLLNDLALLHAAKKKRK